MVLREKYLKKMILFKDKQVIKVITGIRRSGKSVLLKQFYEYLINDGVEKESIIFINFESRVFKKLADADELYEYILRNSNKNKKTYLIFDEIQEVPSWEKVLSSFQVDLNCDIYITGSNAYLLSSELSTYIAGRYVEIHILPFSYKEYLSVQSKDKNEAFDDYLRLGGFPGLTELHGNEELIRDYVEGLYSTIVVKDIINRNKFSDMDLLERILEFMIFNSGSLISANKLANYLSSNGKKTSTSQVLDYLRAFEATFVLYKARRYSFHGKRLLDSPDKYYIIDPGLRNMKNDNSRMDLGHLLENVVYIELVRRGYYVTVGSDRKFEIDFIASKGSEKHYFQVALSIVDEDVKTREIKGLITINDNYPKTLLTMDYSNNEKIDGIHIVNIIDFLLE
ncbi:MAG: ATP-binding protein [Bacillota bacterium]|nr:ATP-binding protein [Bacillota bacterium]